MKYMIEERRKELAKLQGKWFKTASIEREISRISQDIEAGLSACTEYQGQKKEQEYKKSITVYADSFNLASTSYRKKEVSKVLAKIKDDSSPDLYGGYTNKEIEEFSDRIFKYTDFYTFDFNFEKELENDFDKNGIKVFINGFHVGYVPQQINTQLLPYLSKNNIELLGIATIVGGPFKEFDYHQDKVITKKINLGIKVDFKILDHGLRN